MITQIHVAVNMYNVARADCTQACRSSILELSVLVVRRRASCATWTMACDMMPHAISNVDDIIINI